LRPILPWLNQHLQFNLNWPEGLRAMRHRNFRLFFFGQLISVTGTWMQSTAQQWLVYRLTDSQVSLGAVTFAGFIPVLFLSLFMGVVVDRFPRRRLLVWTQTWFLLLAAVLAVITYLGIVQYWQILLLATLLGLGTSLDMPARQTLYADLVEREDLLNAIALNSSMFNVARIIGPAVSGVLVASIGEAPAFAINSLSYLAVIAGLLLMRLTPRSHPKTSATGLTSFREGIGYLKRDRRVLGLVSMTALLSLLVYPYLVLLPVFARDILKIGVEGFGGLMSARGFGALVGALLLALLGSRQHKGRQLAVSRVLLTIAAAGLAVSRTPQLSILMLLLAGFALITQLAVTNTLIQLVVPEELRGRVISAYTWALGGFWPVGSLLMGWLGDNLSAPTAVLIAAGASAVLTLLEYAVFPENRSLR
jgi:MFS family permease